MSGKFYKMGIPPRVWLDGLYSFCGRKWSMLKMRFSRRIAVGDSPGFNAKKLFLHLPLAERIGARLVKVRVARLAKEVERYAVGGKRIRSPEDIVLPGRLTRRIRALTDDERERLGHAVERMEAKFFGEWMKFFKEKNPGSDIFIDENGRFDFYKSQFVFSRESLKPTAESVLDARTTLWKLSEVRKTLSEQKALEAVQRHGRWGLLQYVLGESPVPVLERLVQQAR